MTERKRTRYQQEMDRERLPEKKAQETLRLLLEENGKLREREEKKSAWTFRRLMPVMAAAAACLVLVVGLSVLRPGASGFGSIRLSQLPLSGYRGDSPAASFAEAFGMTPEAMFPGWTVENVETEELPGMGETFHEARLTLTRGETRLEAEASDRAPALWTALQKGDVRYNRDPDTGRLSAVWQKDRCYITVSALGMAEKDFRTAVGEVAAP